LLQSLLLHGAVIGGAATVFWPSPPAPEPESIPIYFEVVEATALDTAEQSVEQVPSAPQEEAEAEPMPVPETVSASVNAGSVPTGDAGSVPNDAGSVPNDAGSVPTGDAGSVPNDAGSVPNEEEGETEKNDDIQSESNETDEVPVEEQSRPIEKATNEQLSSLAVVAAEEHAAVVSDPIALNRIVPVYPRTARRKGHEGVVTVAISVAENGIVAHAEVVSSSGYEELDAAALSAVRSARFAPATSDGVRVRGELRLTFDFRLR